MHVSASVRPAARIAIARNALAGNRSWTRGGEHSARFVKRSRKEKVNQEKKCLTQNDVTAKREHAPGVHMISSSRNQRPSARSARNRSSRIAFVRSAVTTKDAKSSRSRTSSE